MGAALLELLLRSPLAEPILEELGLSWRRALRYMRAGERAIKRDTNLRKVLLEVWQRDAAERRAGART
ncbi:MAG: hypothetical protein M0015_05835 [Betaproteobacteria bacterium]|nr:hypothetical protein [Betaproteobacteria bacterium]